ncbi:threonine synthase [Deferribacter thermophilus]|uniref:threonine synthase n=1 Tax=Deferribacter thermophilus TaxID=53573 RepID=UPI003C1F72C6
MKYKSTRGLIKGISFKEAVLMGLADDGGLLIPESIPSITQDDLMALKDKNYQDVAFYIMSKFVGDIDKEVLKRLIDESYKTFDTSKIVPLVDLDDFYLLELFHGPTLAFKDVALQFLGNLFEYVLGEKGENLNIIGATSGDTGSAAIYGVRGKKGVKIFILHPKGRVSKIQELQMTTVLDENVFNLAVDGTFDDCQYIVKEIFSDLDFKRKYSLGSINSINWARVLAQIVYYFYAYLQTKESERLDKINFIVPTGNFGNILAGFYAKMMGLPVNKLVIATNENNILHRFVQYGDYSIKGVVQTYSPSMDIQIASNFERYLFYLYDEDADKVKASMENLRRERFIKFSTEELKKVHQDFDSTTTDNSETLKVINSVYHKKGYILDPHTACGVDGALKLKDKYEEKFICLSTAHPAKFIDAVKKAINKEPVIPDRIQKLFDKEKRVYDMPNDVSVVKKFIEQHV